MKRRRWLISGLVVLSLVAILVWHFLPLIYIEVLPSFQDKENADLLYRRLLGCGPRSIPTIVATIRSDSAWGSYYDLPLVLHEFGEPAHKALLDAIDREPDAARRAYLSDALVIGFDDYSRIGLWVDDALSGRCSLDSMLRLKTDIYRRWPDAPPLLDDNDIINPDFAAWWKQRATGGLKPALQK
jgi:hypothetical protein